MASAEPDKEALQLIETAIIQYISSEHDERFVECILEALFDLQTDDEKAQGRSIYRNQQGFDASDAARLHRTRSTMTWNDKVELVIKYSSQVASLVARNDIELPSALRGISTTRKRCTFRPMDFREADGKPVRLRRVRPHKVNDETFVVDDSTIVFEDGTHVGRLPVPSPPHRRPRRRRVADSSDDDVPIRRRQSARLAQRRSRGVHSSSDDDDESDDESHSSEDHQLVDTHADEENDETLLAPRHVTQHGIWRGERLVVPSQAFGALVIRLRDEVQRASATSWDPDEVVARVCRVSPTIDADTIDAILYANAPSVTLETGLTGMFRVFDTTRDMWVTARMEMCTVYPGGFRTCTFCASGVEWNTDTCMLYSVGV